MVDEISQANKRGRQPLSAWEVESLRLTAFPMSIPQEQNWWNAVTGDVAEVRNVQPKNNIQTEEGQILDGWLANRVQPDRIDWVLSPTKEQVQRDVAFVTIGSFLEANAKFVQLMSKWFDLDIPEIQRLAYGAILILPVDDRVAGYEQLSAYLHNVRLDPQSMLDFMYQINRPRTSRLEIEGLKINRLSKWSVAATQRFGFLVRSENAVVDRGEQHFACRLEMDINTVPDRQGPIPHNRLRQVLEELVELGHEVVAEGDVP